MIKKGVELKSEIWATHLREWLQKASGSGLAAAGGEIGS
jgi:hypothetical protein